MIRIENLTRAYANSGAALDSVSLTIAEHEFVAITGPSGCGKSTLLHLLAGLDSPTSGEIHVGTSALHRAGDAELTNYRRRHCGVVFQFFNLLPSMTVRENIALPLLLAGGRRREADARADELLHFIGLEARASHFPDQLSGGEMQRTAIARSLVHAPALLLADEPTGSLDSDHAGRILELLQKIASQGRTTLVIVTHSEEVARTATRRIRMRDGRIVEPPLL